MFIVSCNGKVLHSTDNLAEASNFAKAYSHGTRFEVVVADSLGIFARYDFGRLLFS